MNVLVGCIKHDGEYLENCHACFRATIADLTDQIVALRNELDNLKKKYKEHAHYYWDDERHITTETPDYIPDPY